MSQARRPDRRAGQTIRKVLDAGLDELRGSSYAGLTMRAVATRAGVSPATAYTYFPSKNALVASIYLEMLKAAPVHVNVNEPTNARIRETMRDVALVGADEPELTAACASALVAEDPAVSAVRAEIAEETSGRIRAALGPGWPESVASTLELTFSGALVAARFVPFYEITERLQDATDLILAGAVT